MKINNNDIASLAHSKWRCQYHIVFSPKYRRREIYGKIKTDIGKILRQLCYQKGVEINRSRIVSRSYSYVGEYSTEIQRCEFCRIFEREKFFDDF